MIKRWMGAAAVVFFAVLANPRCSHAQLGANFAASASATDMVANGLSANASTPGAGGPAGQAAGSTGGSRSVTRSGIRAGSFPSGPASLNRSSPRYAAFQQYQAAQQSTSTAWPAAPGSLAASASFHRPGASQSASQRKAAPYPTVPGLHMGLAASSESYAPPLATAGSSTPLYSFMMRHEMDGSGSDGSRSGSASNGKGGKRGQRSLIDSLTGVGGSGSMRH